MNVNPHYSWILIRPQQRADRVGSILLPHPTGAEVVGYSTGVVVGTPPSLWPKSFEADEPTPTPFKIGDRVLYRDYLKTMHEIVLDDTTHCLLHWEDILAIVSDDVQVGLGGAT